MAVASNTITQKAPSPAAQTEARRPAPQSGSAAKKKPTMWVWEARTKQGEIRKGEMEGSDAEAVNNRLKSLGLNPTKVKKKPMEIHIKIPGFGGVSGKDLLIF